MRPEIETRIGNELIAAHGDFILLPEVQSVFRRNEGLAARLEFVVDEIVKSVGIAHRLLQHEPVPLSSSFRCRTNDAVTDLQSVTHAVIVPLANESQYLKVLCISSIARNFDPSKCVVVLNAQEACDPAALLPDFKVVTLASDGPFALPQAYNRSVGWLRETFGLKFDELVLVFMDDDAEIVGDQRPAVHALMRRVTAGECLLASGHYFDFSPPPDMFARAIEASGSSDFVKRVPKPYCHGGAALMMRGATFPAHGLPESGLGGISLGILAIESLGKEWSRRVENGDWYLHNDSTLAVQHPRKINILQWSATYLGYARAWGLILDSLNEKNRAHWKLRLDAGRKARRQALLEQAERNGDVHSLSNLLLTETFKRRVVSGFRYDDFRQAGLSVHSNLT
ncbi:hypothetical protein [Roseomonas sp. CECT 9278]|uniref:hypothetical protein n=1 Tax=Roseomonas sp. CECT 9278 TaxID=2845823 RepID=UPI001E29A7AB|nr:hypothetical protein [Roseomonas sp. CECT 9278]CAH0127501.1 hypothetical protein ROS9278_00134 [Roseomonas sp. CECT 9278]